VKPHLGSHASDLISAVLTHGRTGQMPGSHAHWGPCLYIYILCCVQHVFKCLNTDFVGSTNSIYMFNFIDHLHFYSCELLHRWGPQYIALPWGL
jgi:hypothetical protein